MASVIATVGLGHRLYPRGDVGRVAEDVEGIACSPTDHRGARMDADSNGERVSGYPFDLFNDRQSGAHGTFGIILVRLRMSEEREHPVAEIFHDVAAEAGDGARCGQMVPRDEVTPLFRIELLRERRRADKVAEQDGQLTPLALRRGCCSARLARRGATTILRLVTWGSQRRSAIAAKLSAG